MLRLAEAVLDGHPDKFCDILADRVLAAGYAADPACNGQIEVGCWADAIWFSGAILSRTPVRETLAEIVHCLGQEIGAGSERAADARRYRIQNEICFVRGDPRPYNAIVDDQCIVMGWAGYDASTHYLPPEHFLAHTFRQALIDACRVGPLHGRGPDGKLLLRLREEGERWLLEQVVVTLQHGPTETLVELAQAVSQTLATVYARLRAADRRWNRPWQDVELLVNPGGPLIRAGSDGDNGQTGRKLVMDYYGPRLAIGGGALSGKHLAHIDRLAAYAARHAAVAAVITGATACQVTLAYAPGGDEPLDVLYDMDGRGRVLPKASLRHSAMVRRYRRGVDIGRLGRGTHFYDLGLPWNKAPSADMLY